MPDKDNGVTRFLSAAAERNDTILYFTELCYFKQRTFWGMVQ